MFKTFLIWMVCTTVILSTTVIVPAEQSDEILDVMAGELARSMKSLNDPVPYFISYEITQETGLLVSGAFGEIVSVQQNHSNNLYIDLRIGSYQLDNTHSTERSGFDMSGMLSGIFGSGIPVDRMAALKTVLWLQTDSMYKKAIQDFANVESTVQARVEEEDQSGDFSAASAATFLSDPVELIVDEELLQQKVDIYTKAFSDAEHILSNSVQISASIQTRWYVNSEGSKIRVATPLFQVAIFASAKADDGMVLRKSEILHGDSQESILRDQKILAATEKLINDLKALRDAPLAEPYTGPAILSGRASGVFFHEVLGHRLEGQRQKGENEGQTFKSKVGEKVLPETFSVIFDPMITHHGDTQLIGDYPYDNQGVKAQRVVVIDQGILKGFLMSRQPIEGYPVSNGHGRKSSDTTLVVARQSNMFVEVEDPVSPEELEAMLIERIKEQSKAYGLLFDDISGGFTHTGRAMPNAFNVSPVLAYRVYVDGSKEVIRGGNMIGTPLTTFSRVEQASTEVAVFNGMCGAESGWVPVSTVAPAILVTQIEVQRSQTSRDIPPILPSPVRPPGDRSIHTH